MSMIIYPNAKVNLGLKIVSKRQDGFHDIETCFLPVSLSDIIEFDTSNDKTHFSSSGIPIPGTNDNNICVKAWELLHHEFDILPINIHLHKVIPIGAGLGGGSADGAFLLKALSDNFNLNLGTDKLLSLASTLGSDCSFFIQNTPAIGKGRGEILTPITLPVSKFKTILINPGIHISTATAYASVNPENVKTPLEDLLKMPPNNWMNTIKNDFEPGIFSKFPLIADIKRKLLNMGALYASMSGSGSTVFALFEKEIPKDIKNEFKDCFVYYDK